MTTIEIDVQMARELVYKSEDAADQAEVRRAALMTDGRPLIPACLIAMTNGDFAAFEVVNERSGWLKGTRRPMIKVPPM